MLTVQLEEQEWQHVMSLLANAPAPWAMTNPLLMKIGAQLQRQQPMGGNGAAQERIEPGHGELQHPRDDKGRPPAAPGRGRSS